MGFFIQHVLERALIAPRTPRNYSLTLALTQDLSKTSKSLSKSFYIFYRAKLVLKTIAAKVNSLNHNLAIIVNSVNH